jgi:hypothetical protein
MIKLHAHLPADGEEVHGEVKRPRIALLAIVVDAALALKGLDKLIVCMRQCQSVMQPTHMIAVVTRIRMWAWQISARQRASAFITCSRHDDVETLKASIRLPIAEESLLTVSWCRVIGHDQQPRHTSTKHTLQEFWKQNVLRTASSPSLEIVTVAKLLPPCQDTRISAQAQSLRWTSTAHKCTQS